MLTSDTLACLEATSRVLLSPLAAPDVDVWRRDALDAAAALLGADRGLFMLSTAPRVHLSVRADEAYLGVYDQHVAEVTPRGPRLLDPVMQRWLEERRRTGQEVVTNALADRLLAPHGLSLRASSLYNEGMAPGGWADQRTLYVGFSGGEAMVQLGYDQAGRAPDHDASVGLLHVLLPSFRAGLEVLARLGAHRAALDAVAEPLAAFDADGREVHRNAALVRLLEGEPDRDRVVVEVRALARALRPLAAPLRGDSPRPPASPTREVRTARGAYRLRATVLSVGGGPGDTAVLVGVEAVGAVSFPSAQVVRERLGLTAREAEVALLLAEGLTNAQVCERLFIAPATARRHTESIFGKLGVGRRSGVAAAVLGTR